MLTLLAVRSRKLPKAFSATACTHVHIPIQKIYMKLNYQRPMIFFIRILQTKVGKPEKIVLITLKLSSSDYLFMQ